MRNAQAVPHMNWGGMFVAGLLKGLGMMAILFALPGIIGGIGLLKRWAWGRYVCLVVGFFDLFSFPVGTALGVY